MTTTKEEIGDTIPLYDTVKRTIYIKFEELSNSYSSLISSTNNNERKLALWDFKSRYVSFYVEVYHKNKLGKLTDKKQQYLKKAYKNSNKININHSNNIIDICRELIELLGISKIEGRIKDNWAF